MTMRRALRKRRVFDFVPSYLKCSKFHDDSPNGKKGKFNLPSPERDWTFGDSRFCVQLCIESPCYEQLRWHIWPTFPLNFCAFHRRCLSPSSIPWCKNVKNDQNSNQGVLPEAKRYRNYLDLPSGQKKNHHKYAQNQNHVISKNLQSNFDVMHQWQCMQLRPVASYALAIPPLNQAAWSLNITNYDPWWFSCSFFFFFSFFFLQGSTSVLLCPCTCTLSRSSTDSTHFSYLYKLVVHETRGRVPPNGPYSPKGKMAAAYTRWYNAALTHTKWTGNPSSPTFSSNCENGRACFCQTSPGLHVWGVLVPIRIVFNRSNRPRSQEGRQKPSPVFLATLLSRWTTLKLRENKASVAHTTKPKKARLYSCSLQHLLQQLETRWKQRSKQREVTTSWKKIYSMLVTTEMTGKKKHDKNEREDWRTVGEHLINPLSFTQLAQSHGVSGFPAARSLSDLQIFCWKSSCRLLEYKRTFWGVVVFFYAYSSPYALACFVSLCFRVFHLDNHGSWEHQQSFCLFSIPLIDLSA